MADLRRFQSDFAAALRDRDRTPALARWLAGDAATAARRLDIYRANLAAGARKALADAYPVVLQAVGGEFFGGLARAYRRDCPSTSGDLADFGAGLPAFLASFEPVRELPWLPDLARLEWAVHRAARAADAPAWDRAALAALAPGRQQAVRLRWAPGTALVAASFPVVRLWTIHRPGHAGEFAVDWTLAETALVAREGLAVTVAACTAGALAFLEASLAGATLGDAAAAALEAEPGLDLGALLGHAFASGQVCGCDA